jgi:excisionase family DNA binding protein
MTEDDLKIPKAANDNDAPRGITRAEAAKYCGVSPSTFSRWIATGIMPGAIPGTRIWDRHAVDQAFNKMSGAPLAPANDNSVDAWFEANYARAS